jgi:hypothetical protein
VHLYKEGRGGERRATGAVGLFVDVSARVYCIEQH